MAQQTAVEWLEQKLKDRYSLIHSQPLFEQAKQMEKQQIMMAIKDSWYMAKGSNFQEPQEEQYYNETYGSKGSDGNFKQFSLYEHKETITSA